MDFSREQLQDKNLFELREIARENRVQSPTKLNKEELISQIVEASSQRVKGLKSARFHARRNLSTPREGTRRTTSPKKPRSR